MKDSFVHLHVHTEYSIIDSIIRIDDLMQRVKSCGMSAVALTDHGNLFAVIKFYQAAIALGIKPIIGCEIVFYDSDNKDKPHVMVLLCKNLQGYRNLTHIVSKSYQEGQYLGRPQVQIPWLVEKKEGLIAISCSAGGDIAAALLNQDLHLAQARARFWMDVFPDSFYLEITRTQRAHESIYNKALVKLADNLFLPLVASNDLRFLHAEDYDAHEARVCIHNSTLLNDDKRDRLYSDRQYLRSASEMAELFADLPQALQNTAAIAQRCTLELELGKNFLPNFVTPNGQAVETYLRDLAHEGLALRFTKFAQDINKDQYFSRLDLELKVIISLGFAGYFLIVADFIGWAKHNDIPVGPGRGSGAGSLVAYALAITDLDPLQYDLLFERFLNPERVSMPDFDIDFCMEGRDRVIEYVSQKYGHDSVSQIITFGTMAAKAVVRDVGRVLGHPYGFVDTLAKLIPFELGITLKDALAKQDELKTRYENSDEVRELFDLALKLEGIVRNAGKHAGGVVIAPSKLSDFTAVYCEHGSTQIVSQFDKDDVESAGLVKFDFLGLSTLTVIAKTLKLINANRASQNLSAIDINFVPLDDAKCFALLNACQTTAVFQLESRGMKELVHRLKPDRFEEIIALVALFRPGPLQSGMVDDFIDRKHGRAALNYLHPDLEAILKPTYGVILYQEQVMQIAQVLANYTLGAADLLRRAMGKKKPEEMAKQREIFIEGASQRGVLAETATLIFDLMEKFAGYGFNKSHSAVYALISYQTAWLKAHYPAEFMASVLTLSSDNTDKLVIMIHDCFDMGLTILPPNINSSMLAFTVKDSREILFGLGAIKGVGSAAIEAILLTRDTDGLFRDLFDLSARVDTRKVNKRVLESLIKAGALDVFGTDRAILCAQVETALKLGMQMSLMKKQGQLDMFAVSESEYFDTSVVTPWRLRELLDYEKDVLGLYLTAHPCDMYYQEMSAFVTPLVDIIVVPRRKIKILGMIDYLRKVNTKNGKYLLIVGLSDAKRQVEVVVFPEKANLELLHAIADAHEISVFEVDLSQDKYTRGIKLTATSFYDILTARNLFLKKIVLNLASSDAEILDKLESLVKDNPGKLPVFIDYCNDKVKISLKTSHIFCVEANDDFLIKLYTLLNLSRVFLCYT
jgi:DNA polymerase III subunit alpha